MYQFVLNLFFIYYCIFFLQAMVGANSKKAYLYFRLVCTSGGFVRLENNDCTPNTNNYV